MNSEAANASGSDAGYRFAERQHSALAGFVQPGGLAESSRRSQRSADLR